MAREPSALRKARSRHGVILSKKSPGPQVSEWDYDTRQAVLEERYRCYAIADDWGDVNIRDAIDTGPFPWGPEGPGDDDEE